MITQLTMWQYENLNYSGFGIDDNRFVNIFDACSYLCLCVCVSVLFTWDNANVYALRFERALALCIWFIDWTAAPTYSRIVELHVIHCQGIRSISTRVYLWSWKLKNLTTLEILPKFVTENTRRKGVEHSNEDQCRSELDCASDSHRNLFEMRAKWFRIKQNGNKIVE